MILWKKILYQPTAPVPIFCNQKHYQALTNSFSRFAVYLRLDA